MRTQFCEWTVDSKMLKNVNLIERMKVSGRDWRINASKYSKYFPQNLNQFQEKLETSISSRTWSINVLWLKRKFLDVQFAGVYLSDSLSIQTSEHTKYFLGIKDEIFSST